MKYILRKGEMKKGNYKQKPNFTYVNDQGREVTNKDILEYIRKVRVPPAYRNVKIYMNKCEKVLATGIDDAGRKQYVYNPDFVKKQNKKKQCKMIDFSKNVNKILKDIDRLLEQKTLNHKKIVAAIIKIMLVCHFRIGNEKYKEKYQSYGITTITRKHVKFIGNGNTPSAAEIRFIGKKGVDNFCKLKDVQLVGILRTLVRNNGGSNNKPVFTHKREPVTSKDINKFLRHYGEFTAKQFRTWSANMLFIETLNANLANIDYDHVTKRKKLVAEIFKEISPKLHHTPAICKKSYVNSDLVDTLIANPQRIVKIMRKEKTANDVFIKFLQKKCKRMN